MPSKAWRDREHRRFLRCKERNNYTDAQIAAGTKCGFIDRAWSVGDNINLRSARATWQANPLQMAVAYAAIANAAEGKGGRCCARGSASGSRTRWVRPSRTSRLRPRAS